MTESMVTPDACSAAMHENDHATKALGMQIVSTSLGGSVVSMKVRQDMLNGFGSCHGGMIFSLADTAFAHACNSGNKPTVASGCTIDFIAPSKEGDTLTARASERSRSGKTGIYDIEVFNQDEQLIATFRGRSYQLKGSIVPEVAE